MRKVFGLVILLFGFSLTSCVTDGWNDPNRFMPPQQEHMILGSVSVTKRYIQPLFIGPSSLQKRNQLTDLLKIKAKENYGDTAEIDNIKFESSWHPASLLFYFSMLGFIEDAGASASVYDPIAEKQVIQKKQDEIQQVNKIQEDKAKMIGSDIVINSISTSTPNSASGVDIHINYKNIGNQEIKYITFGVVPYNRVNDPVSCTISNKSLQYCKITGPVAIGVNSTAYFENAWYNSTISYAKIHNIEIIYMDNTKKTFDDMNEIANSIVKN